MFWFRIRKKKIRRWSLVMLFLLSILSCYGCGAAAGYETIPELAEPVSRSDLYRPVERGKIETTKVLSASVVPMEYAQFFETEMEIVSIPVHIGEMVEEGDVLAYVDVSYVGEQLDALRTQLTLEEEQFRINGKIKDSRLQEMNGLKQQLSGGGDSDLLGDYDIQIGILQEDFRYDTLLHQYRIDKLEKEIEVLEEIASVGELRASHGGMVTYLADITYYDGGYSSVVSAYENVAVISDTEDCYLELDELPVNGYEYEEYEAKYILAGGERYPVSEILYSPEELIAAEAAGSYPYVRMTLPEMEEVSLGDRFLVYFTKTNVGEVLMVGNDSLYSDGEGSFVYVKTDTDEKEKRRVTTGAVDAYYTEIIEGLSEGELVYYSIQEVLPADYETYTVESSVFSMDISMLGRVFLSGSLSYAVEGGTSLYKYLSGGATHTYCAEFSGTVVELTDLTDGDWVTEGDLICCVDTGIGNAAITEQKYKIEDENRSYEKTIASYEEQEKALRESGLDALSLACELKILEYQRELAAITHEATLSGLQAEYEAMTKDNDGTGKIYMYARQSGILSFRKYRWEKDTRIQTGDTVTEGEQIFYITEPNEDQLVITGDSNRVGSVSIVEKYGLSGATDVGTLSPVFNDTTLTANIGQEVTVTSGGEAYTGTVTGIGGGQNFRQKVYLTWKDGKYVVSQSTSFSQAAFYVELEDPSVTASLVSDGVICNFLTLEDALVVPSDYVCQGEDASNQTVSYVWKVTDGELVKQYVSVNPYYCQADESGEIYYLVFSGLETGDVLAIENQ